VQIGNGCRVRTAPEPFLCHKYGWAVNAPVMKPLPESRLVLLGAPVPGSGVADAVGVRSC
jgi:hypothetical protein